jgi:2-dehydro-3-deoxygluconokinase
MIELLDLGDGTMRQGFGGDVFNTAAYLARQACQAGTDGAKGATPGAHVEFVTVTGDDVYSREMRALWRRYGVGDAYAPVLPGGRAGLYLIRRDADGERTFYHYRSESAARQLFGPGQPAWIDKAVVGHDVVYFSAITLSILTEAARARLTAVLGAARARGALVAFDGNFRASGWPSVSAARTAMTGVLPHIDIALPTLADEQLVFADSGADACVRRLRDGGVAEIAVKLGAAGCLVAGRGDTPVRIPAVPGVTVVDTTAAGDAFNGAYLAARLSGAPAREAGEAGNALAAEVIAHPGALLPPCA